MPGSIGPKWFRLRPCSNSGSGHAALAVPELQYVLQHIVIDKIIVSKKLVLVISLHFSVAIAQSTTGTTTTTTMAAASKNGP
jgi:hypothetical protein